MSDKNWPKSVTWWKVYNDWSSHQIFPKSSWKYIKISDGGKLVKTSWEISITLVSDMMIYTMFWSPLNQSAEKSCSKKPILQLLCAIWHQIKSQAKILSPDWYTTCVYYYLYITDPFSSLAWRRLVFSD